jgi:integrase
MEGPLLGIYCARFRRPWGEVAGLHWDDVDLDASPATLTVRRSYQGDPKNAGSATTVALHDELVPLLKRLKEDADSEWLLPSALGKARRRMSGADRKALHAAAQRAGIKKHVTPHVFRHTFGTLLYASTTDPKAVQRLMRHAAIKTTMEVHVKDDRPLEDKINSLPAIRAKTQLRVV